MSICSIEQVHAATKTPPWFQVYVLRDHGFNAVGRGRVMLDIGIISGQDLLKALAQ